MSSQEAKRFDYSARQMQNLLRAFHELVGVGWATRDQAHEVIGRFAPGYTGRGRGKVIATIGEQGYFEVEQAGGESGSIKRVRLTQEGLALAGAERRPLERSEVAAALREERRGALDEAKKHRDEAERLRREAEAEDVKAAAAQARVDQIASALKALGIYDIV